jgi:hypothetical protein
LPNLLLIAQTRIEESLRDCISLRFLHVIGFLVST